MDTVEVVEKPKSVVFTTPTAADRDGSLDMEVDGQVISSNEQEQQSMQSVAEVEGYEFADDSEDNPISPLLASVM